MRARRSVVLALASFLVLLGACSDMPSESDAEAAYTEHKASIDDTIRALNEGMRALPLKNAVRCTQPDRAVAQADPAVNAAFEACHARRTAWVEQTYEGWRRLRARVPALLIARHDDLLGITINMRADGDSMRYPITTGTTRPSKVGVPAAQGFTRDGRHVGYHLYRTAVAFRMDSGEMIRRGDAKQREGLEITYTLRDHDLIADVTITILMKDKTPENWRAAHVARLVD